MRTGNAKVVRAVFEETVIEPSTSSNDANDKAVRALLSVMLIYDVMRVRAGS